MVKWAIGQVFNGSRGKWSKGKKQMMRVSVRASALAIAMLQPMWGSGGAVQQKHSKMQCFPFVTQFAG